MGPTTTRQDQEQRTTAGKKLKMQTSLKGIIGQGLTGLTWEERGGLGLQPCDFIKTETPT